MDRGGFAPLVTLGIIVLIIMAGALGYFALKKAMVPNPASPTQIPSQSLGQNSFSTSTIEIQTTTQPAAPSVTKLSGKIIYEVASSTHNIEILDFDRNLKFVTGISTAYDPDYEPFLFSQDGTQLVLPGHGTTTIKAYPLSLAETMLPRALACGAAPEPTPLYFINFDKPSIQDVGDYTDYGGIHWVDNNSVCFTDWINTGRCTGMPGKTWKISPDSKTEISPSQCTLATSTQLSVGTKYKLDPNYESWYEATLSDPRANQTVSINSSSSCVSIPVAKLSPDQGKLAYMCRSSKNPLGGDDNTGNQLYITNVSDVFSGNYDNSQKITLVGSGPYFHFDWMNQNNLLVRNEKMGQRGLTSISLVDIISGKQHILASGGGQLAYWSPSVAPSGNAFAVETTDNTTSTPGIDSEIEIISLDGRVLLKTPGTNARWFR